LSLASVAMFFTSSPKVVSQPRVARLSGNREKILTHNSEDRY